jgi:prophage tail gpP-like protein
MALQDDRVTLQASGQEIVIAESWDVDESMFHTPAAWTMRLGSSENAAEILRRFPKGAPYVLAVAGVPQLSGTIDGRHCSGQATQVALKGRDILGKLHDTGTELNRSFRDATYSELVSWAIEQSGLDPKILSLAGNLKNRQLKAGIPIAELQATVFSDVVNQEAGSSGAAKGESVGQIVRQDHQSRIDESMLTFVRRLLDRAGVMIWAAADGRIILGLPNASQKPAYRIVRRLKKSGVTWEGGNVVDYDFTDDASRRHARVAVYGKHGGRHAGRGYAKGAYVDDELVNAPNQGYTSVVCYRDVDVQSEAQAEFYARRKLAEERRDGWQLSYTVSGLTMPAIGSGYRAIPTIDTTIEVIDEVLGLEDVFYMEGVRRQRDPHTTTTLRLMRKGDIPLGGEG